MASMFNCFKHEHTGRLTVIEPDKLSHEPTSDYRKDKVETVEFSRGFRRNTLYGLLGIFLLLILWAWCTELDEIGQAPGQLIPSEEVQTVKADLDATVDKVLVKMGDQVKCGDVLLVIDTQVHATECEKLKREVQITQRELSRHENALAVLEAFFKNPDVLSPDLSSVTAVAQAIGQVYAARRRLARAEADMGLVSKSNRLPELGALSSQREHVKEQREFKQLALQHRQKQFEKDFEKLSRKIASSESQLELQQSAEKEKSASLECSKQQLAAYERVYLTGGSSKKECLDARMQVEESQRELTMAQTKTRELVAELETLRHELEQTKLKNETSVSQMQAGVTDVAASEAEIPIKMRAAERALLEARAANQIAMRAAESTRINEVSEIGKHRKQVQMLEASLRAEEHLRAKGTVRAPVEGVVALIHAQGAGEVVQRGQPLLTVVPTKEELFAEVYVANENVGFVQKGQRVQLQLPAYPYQQFGTIPGTVELIDDLPAEDKQHDTKYKALIKPDRDFVWYRGRKILLRKGLDVDAQIILRKRRLLVSLLAPLLQMQYLHFKG